MISLDEIRSWFEKRRDKIYRDLFTFLQFSSISTDSKYRKSMQECADWLVSYLQKGNFSAELLQTETIPIVFAEKKAEDPKAKTVLVYGHYDVQPVDPISEWKSDPFTPEERGGDIYARGASDDKGQIFYAIVGAMAALELAGKLTVNLKFCIEGEEESHSLGLTKALSSYREKFKADALVVVDFGSLPTGPAVSLGARGIAAMEVILKGSDTDLHSGMFGGVSYNPLRALVEMLSHIWDGKGRVQVPGFYSDVEEEKEPSRFYYPWEKGDFAKMFGIRAFGGIEGKSLLENNWFLPTVEINGISGGYAGEGMKTVIPAKATAKLSMRLVPSQDPEQVLASLQAFLLAFVPEGMEVEFISHGGDPAWRGALDSFASSAIFKAAEEVTGQKCSYILTGGSIPVVPHFVKELNVEVTGMGYALGSDNVHAPNEHFGKKCFEQGLFTFAKALGEMGKKCSS